jgi:Zn-dependent protease
MISQYFFLELVINGLVLFACFPIHEAAHAWAADRLGDDTGRIMRRITLNPFAHLDLWGSISMLIFGFGWAKPVPVNINRFKNVKLGYALTALAGPMSNVLMATVAMIVMKVCMLFAGTWVVSEILSYVVFLNLGLAIFNLIPLPPLDGSKVLAIVLTNRAYGRYLEATEPYSMYFLFGVLLLANSGFLPIDFLIINVYNGLDILTSFIK